MLLINPQLSHETINHITRHFEQRGDVTNRNEKDPHPYAAKEYAILDRWGKIIKNGKFE